jgi:integrase/recombinase XerD
MTKECCMVRIRLRYVVEDIDRCGNIRRYFRRKGQQKVRLRGLPGSEEFMASYRAALSGIEEVKRQYQRTAKGSFGYVCQHYYASPTYKLLDESTQTWRRRALDSISQRNGHKPIGLMKPKHIRNLRDELIDKPGAARTRLKALKALFRWAIDADEVSYDPSQDVTMFWYVSKPHHTWTVGEVEAFEASHPLGSKARLAMAIMLYTTCHREDVIRLGPQHIKNGRVQFRQAKNENRNPIDINIPLYPDLAEVIAATPSQHLTFLVTDLGKPFTPAGFGNKFREWCNQADLPHCTSHGLRKATSTRLAERGATAHEIMAITGHQSLQEVERYTRAVRKSQLADSAMAKLKR